MARAIASRQSCEARVTEVLLDYTNASVGPVDDWDAPPNYDALTTGITTTYEKNVEALMALVEKDFPGLGAPDGFKTAGASQRPDTPAAQ